MKNHYEVTIQFKSDKHAMTYESTSTITLSGIKAKQFGSELDKLVGLKAVLDELIPRITDAINREAKGQLSVGNLGPAAQ